jgi:hypothetical protein
VRACVRLHACMHLLACAARVGVTGYIARRRPWRPTVLAVACRALSLLPVGLSAGCLLPVVACCMLLSVACCCLSHVVVCCLLLPLACCCLLPVGLSAGCAVCCVRRCDLRVPQYLALRANDPRERDCNGADMRARIDHVVALADQLREELDFVRDEPLGRTRSRRGASMEAATWYPMLARYPYRMVPRRCGIQQHGVT